MNTNQHLTDKNNAVFEMATAFVNETSQHVFLTGKAGTGKTTFLRYIREHTLKTTVVAAPTGVAAINAGGVTLHSLFQLPFDLYVPGSPVRKDKFRFGKAKLDLLRNLELLIIDEVSMLRADTLDAIDNTMQNIRRNSLPFGGIQVLYIGDLFQLPPVVKEEEWSLLRPYYESPFFFYSQVVKRTNPVYLELKTVYRQSEEQFVNVLNNVRNNCLTEHDLNLLNARYQPKFVPTPQEKYITLTTHNNKADRINRQELDKLPSKEYIFSGLVEGEFPDYALPTDMQLSLKKGAQVMFIRNDSNGRYFNGKIATVQNIDDDRITVQMPDTGETIDVNQEQWENIRYTLNKETGEMEAEPIGSYLQYPLRLAWAVTIHKSQGLTFDKAIIDIGASFAPGQTYVALSRCTSLEGIVLRTPVSPKCVMTDTHAVDFSRTEKAENELNDILSNSKRQFWRERLLRYFEWKPMFTFLWELEKLLEDKGSEEYELLWKHLENFRKTVREMAEVAGKFRTQLAKLTIEAEQTDDLNPLRDRCQKAIAYFHENTVNRILLPLQQYVEQSDVLRRAKVFHKHLLELEDDVRLFLENMKRVRYNNILLADTMNLTVPRHRETTSASQKTTNNKTPKKKNKAPSGEPEIDTRTQSLILFKEGKSIAEIAELRQLAISTVEGHLATFIGYEIPIEAFFTPEELAEITKALAPILDMEKPSFKPIYEQTGGKYSYGKLKMAFNYHAKKN